MNRFVHSNRQVKNDYLFIIAIFSTLLFSSATISNYGHSGVTNVVYGQSDIDQANSTNTTNLVNLQDIPLEKVRVGDIEMAYKMFGKGDPIILFNGASDGMDAWDPSFLTVFLQITQSLYLINVELEIQQLVPNHILIDNLQMIQRVC